MTIVEEKYRMARLRTQGIRGLFAASLFLAVSAAQANTYYHPLCEGSGGKQATSCTNLQATYVYVDVQGGIHAYPVDRVEAVISEDCEVATNRGPVTVVAAKENSLILPDDQKRYAPMTVDFVFPTGCAVKLHGRRNKAIGRDVVRWFPVRAGTNIGRRSEFRLNMEQGAVQRTYVQP